MMPSPDLERFATLIADDVISAYERKRPGPLTIRGQGRDMVVSVIVRELMRVLPGADGAGLAEACNRALDETVGAMGLGGPRVEAVDLADGSVTMSLG